MQFDSRFWVPFLGAASAIIIAVVASHLGGFLGITIAGLLIIFAAVRYDLEKSDVGGGFPSPTLYRRQIAAREQLARDEQIAQRATLHALWRPLFIARTIGIGLTVLGLVGCFFL